MRKVIVAAAQRWRERKALYRGIGRAFSPRQYEVEEIVTDRKARAFVEQHHYTGSYPAAVARFGLHRAGRLVGVAVYSVPPHPAVLTRWFRDRPALEIGRLVLLDEVPGNAESWFVARCHAMLKRDRDLRGVLAFADPTAGHVGIVYQALNAVHHGRGRADVRRVLPNGRVFSRRAMTKIRTRDRGWIYASSILREHGADEVWDDAGAWLEHWLPRLTRKKRHPGCLRYLWSLDRRGRGLLPPGDPYPRLVVRSVP